MSNMSYCRFQNTLPDLEDCYESMDEDDQELGETEANARTALIAVCAKIVEEYGEESD